MEGIGAHLMVKVAHVSGHALSSARASLLLAPAGRDCVAATTTTTATTCCVQDARVNKQQVCDTCQLLTAHCVRFRGRKVQQRRSALLHRLDAGLEVCLYKGGYSE